MKVEYNKALESHCIEIRDSASATCITVEDAKKLRDGLTKAIEEAETPEPELTEFEREARYAIVKHLTTTVTDGRSTTASTVYIGDDTAKKLGKELLEIARQELAKECHGEVEDDALNKQLQIWFEKGKTQGRDEALKDLPRWKKATKRLNSDDTGETYFTLTKNGEMSPYYNGIVNEGEFYIALSDIEELPKED